MLVLTRKEAESIVIGNEVKVTIVSVGPGRVKLGIEAPKWMAIDREEVHERKANEIQADVIVNTGVHNRLSGQFETCSDPRKSR